jgi:hypothetical protein
MYICMYMCVYVCMYVCMCVCMYVYVRMYVYLYIPAIAVIKIFIFYILLKVGTHLYNTQLFYGLLVFESLLVTCVYRSS